MTGFRNHKRVNPFVQIDKNILSDKKISWKAKGILAYLLSKPDNWVTYMTDIQKQSKDGRDSVSSGVKELLDAGYLERRRLREKGRFKGWEYIVFEVPKSAECGKSEVGDSEGKPTEYRKSEVDKSENGEAENGKPATSNNDLTNNDLTNNNYNNDNERAHESSNLPPATEKPKENPFTFFEQNRFGPLGTHIGDKIGAWIEDLNEELVLKAMKIAVENGAINWAYVETILRDWSGKRITSIQEYEAHELKRKNKNNARSGGRRYGPPVKEALVPEWFHESKSESEKVKSDVPEQSAADLEERKRRLREELAKTSVKRGSS